MLGIFHASKWKKKSFLVFTEDDVTGIKSFTVKYDAYVQAQEISLWKMQHKRKSGANQYSLHFSFRDLKKTKKNHPSFFNRLADDLKFMEF